MAKSAAAGDDRKGIGDRIGEWMQDRVDQAKEWWANLRIGDGHASAMGRLGWRELRNAVSLGRESVADTEIGLYGTATQGEIATAREDTGLDAEEEKKVAKSPPAQEAQPSPEPPAQEAQQEAPQQGQQEQLSVLGYPLESGGQSHGGQQMERQHSRGRGR